MTGPPRISVAVPVYNEEAVIPELVARLGRVLTALTGGPHEIVFVDDGSTDRSLELLEAAARRDPRITVVSLSRNFGHQAAITAALDHVDGDVTVIMDGDLQDAPEDIPRLLEGHALGHDVVYAVRRSRREGWLVQLCYRVFYRLIGAMSDLRLPLDAGDFGLLSRRVVEVLRATPERHRYLRGLRAWAGFRQIGIPVDRGPRGGGASKYGTAKLLRLALDGIFAFSIVPIRLASVCGFLAVLGASVYVLYAIYARLFLGTSPRGFTVLVVAVTFFAGVQLVFLGILGEYLGRVYEEVKGRPHYVIQRLTRSAPR